MVNWITIFDAWKWSVNIYQSINSWLGLSKLRRCSSMLNPPISCYADWISQQDLYSLRTCNNVSKRFKILDWICDNCRFTDRTWRRTVTVLVQPSISRHVTFVSRLFNQNWCTQPETRTFRKMYIYLNAAYLRLRMKTRYNRACEISIIFRYASSTDDWRLASSSLRCRRFHNIEVG